VQRASAVPPVVAGYQYVRLLGSGGFSDVFLYDQAFPKRRVAVKVLLLEELTQESRNAFTAEANVMAQLSAHPYIVTIFQAAVTEDDRPYLVMEYCSGPSLAEQYKKQPLSVPQTLEMGVRLSSAIATAHAAGILHRDIKPANVLTNQFGWPALTDFGISSTVDDFAPTMTTTSRAAGNPAATGGGTASVGMSIPWSPPEMFDDEPNPGVRSDVFSLAATLYTVLAGHTPFEIPGRSNGSVDLIGRIARGAITPMSRADVPASLVAVLQKGMASDPDDRFATAVEFGRALQRVEVELSYPQTPLDIPNIAIDRPERSGEGEESSADETRARVIPTVHAQTAAPITAPPAQQTSAPAPTETVVRRPVDAVDHTQLRRPEVTHAAPIAPEVASPETVRRAPANPVVAESAEVAPKQRRRGVLLSVVVAIVVVVAVIVVAAFVANGAKTPTAGSTQGGGGNAGPPSGEDNALPTPTKPVGVVSADGKTVTFTWTNPSPKSGDTYRWSLYVDGALADTKTDLPTPQATNVPYNATPTCIRAYIVRNLAISTGVKGCVSR
jgi:eukaryotic-like serine/threonine-protein kinase